MYLKIFFNDQPLIFTTKYQQGIFFDSISSDQNFESLLELPAGHSPVIWQVKTLEEWKTILKDRFKIIQAGGGIVVNRNSHLLMIFRKGKWDLPKGKLDTGEEIEACAVREVGEETGLKEIEPGRHLSTTYHSYKHKGEWVLKESVWFMMSTSYDGDLQPQLEEEIEECRWVPHSDLYKYLPEAHASIRELLNTLGETSSLTVR